MKFKLRDLFKRVVIVKKETTITYEQLSPEQKQHFDNTFKKMDEAFDELDKVFKK